MEEEKKAEEVKGGELLFCGTTVWDAIGRRRSLPKENLVSSTRLRPLMGTEKVDLENTVVDESQRQWKEVGSSSTSTQDKYSAFAVSGYASTDGRNCKPFNPLLGETYEADYPDKCVRFFSEKQVVGSVVILIWSQSPRGIMESKN